MILKQRIPNTSLTYVAPVLLGFFVMSACDLVGIGIDNVKADFGLNNTLSQLISLAVFVWFFLLSVPIGILQERIGKRNMLNIGIVLTAIGLFLPFFVYSFLTVMIGFGLLGIGNTIIQVSANPLLTDVVPSGKASSFLSFSQFIKSIVSSSLTLLTTLLFIFSPTPFVALALMFSIGLAASNIFPLIFASTVKKYPDRANEISGLMIMAVSGGAFIPPIIGGISDLFTLTAGLYVLVFGAIYLLFLSIYSSKLS